MSQCTIERVYEFLLKTNTAPDLSVVLSALKNQMDVYGCEYMVFGPATLSAADVMIKIDPDKPFIINYPADWISRYAEKNYYAIDPVIEYCARATAPFTWDELKAWPNQNPQVKRFWKESEDYGLKYGITFPLHGSFDQRFVLSLSTQDKSVYDNIVLNHMDEIHVVAYQFYLTYTSGNNNEKTDYTLTPREKEVLLWAANGKSAWETGMILNISEHTVNTHLKNIIKKLEVSTKTAAAVKAIKYGLISFYP